LVGGWRGPVEGKVTAIRSRKRMRRSKKGWMYYSSLRARDVWSVLPIMRLERRRGN
jgi:hypothetical protein